MVAFVRINVVSILKQALLWTWKPTPQMVLGRALVWGVCASEDNAVSGGNRCIPQQCYTSDQLVLLGLKMGHFLVFVMGVVAMVASENKTLFNFRNPETQGSWRIVNDGVMGGISQSKVEIQDGTASFSGTLSLDNNGGFASVRAAAPDTHLSGYDGFLIRVKGDGKVYKLRLRTNQNFDGVAYSQDFATKANQWQTVTLAADQFTPMFRGRLVSAAPPLDMASVRQIGFLISDKQEGSFHLKIEKIQAYQRR